MLAMSPELNNLILNGASVNEIKATAMEQGMRSLHQIALSKLTEGLTTVEEILKVIKLD